MQKGLLDFIFQNLEVQGLSRKEINAYLNFLNEIITAKLTVPEQAKYLDLKVKLNNRLMQLDKNNIAENNNSAEVSD